MSVFLEVEKKEDLIKDFKVAIASTVKSVSNINDLEVVFGSQNLESQKKTIRLLNRKTQAIRLTIQKLEQ